MEDLKRKLELLLIENVLYPAISAFHDCDDKQKREQYVKEYVLDFCQENNLDIIDTLDILNSIFEEKRKRKMFTYQHYKGNALKTMVLGKKQKSNSKK